MRRRVEVCSHGESEADQGHEGSHGVHDKNGGQCEALASGEREVGVGSILK